jgi:hypothetical protein
MYSELLARAYKMGRNNAYGFFLGPNLRPETGSVPLEPLSAAMTRLAGYEVWALGYDTFAPPS